MIEEYFKNKKIIPYSEFAPYNKIGDRRFWDNIKGGEFYTPASVVKTIVAILKPFKNCRVYDPCCGSGGMFVQSAKFGAIPHFV